MLIFKTPHTNENLVKRFKSKCKTQLQISNFSKIIFLLPAEISEAKLCHSWFFDGRNQLMDTFWSEISDGNKFSKIRVHNLMENTFHNNDWVLSYKAWDLIPFEI